MAKLEYEDLGYEDEKEFIEELLGLDESWTLEDFCNSYDPD